MATVPLVLDLIDVDQSVLPGALITVAYDRDVNIAGVGRVPDPAEQSYSPGDTVQVIPNDDSSLAASSKGYGITVTAAWSLRSDPRGPQQVSKSWTVVVTSATALTSGNALFSTLPSAQPVPPQFLSIADYSASLQAEVVAAQAASAAATAAAAAASGAQAAALATPDAQVTSLVGNASSSTSQALAGTYLKQSDATNNYLAKAGADTAVANLLGQASSASRVASDALYVGSTAQLAAQTRQGIIVPPTVTHADVQAALTSAQTFAGRVVIAGSYTTSNTLTIQAHCDLSGLTINYTGTGTAVVIGTSSTPSYRFRIRAPQVINANKTANGWAQTGVPGTVGIDIVDTYASSIEVPLIRNFQYGLQFRGANGQGTQQNSIWMGHADNNQVNFHFTGDSTGWANQNYIFGGRASHNSNEGNQVSGTRHVLFDSLPNPVNGNSFYGTSLETPGVYEYVIEAASSLSNVFTGCRFENSLGDAYRRILSSGTSAGNMIVGGIYANAITQVITGSTAQPFDIDTPGRLDRRGGLTTYPTAVLENIATSTGSALTVMAPGAGNARSDPEAAYCLRVSSQRLAGKRPTDPAGQDRVVMDYLNGRVYVGDGTAAPISYLSGIGAFFLFGGATTVGALTDGGASLGGKTSYRFDYVRAKTALVTGSGPTSSRPNAAVAGVGAMFYDTTLSKPIWSDGTTWRDATGTAV